MRMQSAFSLMLVIVALTLSSTSRVDAVVCAPQLLGNPCGPAGPHPVPSFHPAPRPSGPPLPTSHLPPPPSLRQDNDDTPPPPNFTPFLDSINAQAATLSSDQAKADFYYRIYNSDPRSPAARVLKFNWVYFQGLAYWDVKQYAAAVRWYQRAIRLAPAARYKRLVQNEAKPLFDWYAKSEEEKQKCINQAVKDRELALAESNARSSKEIDDCGKHSFDEEQFIKCVAARKEERDARNKQIEEEAAQKINDCKKD